MLSGTTGRPVGQSAMKSCTACWSPPRLIRSAGTEVTGSTPPYVGTEREILVAYLDWHRATFEAKCTGIPPERLSERTVPPSTLTLHELVRHLAGAERWWFRIQFARADVTSSRPPVAGADRHRLVHRSTGVASACHGSPDRRIRPAQRARRPATRGHRRRHRSVGGMNWLIFDAISSPTPSG